MFADLTWERETEILIAALTHEEIQTAVAPALTGYLSSVSHCLPPKSFNGVIALNSAVNLSPTAYGSN